MRRKRRAAVSRGSPPAGRFAAARPPVAALWRPWLLGGMTALFVARPLFPSESAASYGDGLTVVMLWIALGVFWLLGAVGRRNLGFASDGPTPPCCCWSCGTQWPRFGPSATAPPAGRQRALGMGRHGVVLLPGAAVHRHAPRGPGHGRRDGRPGGGRLGLRAIPVRL